MILEYVSFAVRCLINVLQVILCTTYQWLCILTRYPNECSTHTNLYTICR